MHQLTAALASLGLLLLAAQAAKHKIPSYIDICKRNDPHLDDCIIKSVDKLRPKLKSGIPELEVPGLEPLVIPSLDVSRSAGVKARGTNITVRGASNFKITRLRSDLKNTKFFIGIKIPFLTFRSNYDVNAQILVLPVKGRGTLSANATDVEGDAVLKGKKVKRDGDTYLEFTELKLDLLISNYNIHLDNLFNGNKELGEAVNLALNENKRDFMKSLKPTVERVVSNVLLDIARNVTKHFTFDELFPEK